MAPVTTLDSLAEELPRLIQKVQRRFIDTIDAPAVRWDQRQQIVVDEHVRRC